MRIRASRAVGRSAVTATLGVFLALGGLPPVAQAAVGDPLPHAPLPAYKYSNPKPAITINTADSPDLTTWMNTQVKPLLTDWYPVIGDYVIGKYAHLSCLPAVGIPCPPFYTIPTSFTIKSDATYGGVAYTTSINGVRTIVFGSAYARANQPNLYGVLIHEMTHIVEQGSTSPFWFTEGLADYIRFFVYQDFRPALSLNGTYVNGYGNAAILINYIQSLKPSYTAELEYQTFLKTYTQASTTSITGTSIEAHWKNLTGHAITTINNMRPGNATSRCIDLPGFASTDGTRPDIWDCVSQDNERWVATDQDTAAGGFIQGAVAAKCLTVNTAIPSNGGFAVDYRPCSTANVNQKFLRRADATVYNAATNRCLRPAAAGTVNGTKLEVVTCAATQTAQQWTWKLAI